MVNKAVKALVIIACICTGILAVLLAPLQSVQYNGTNLVQFSESVDQINLITNSEIANVEIRYATDSNAPLINMTYHYLIRHAIIFSPPNVTVSFINSTVGKILTVQLTVDLTAIGLTSIASSVTILTINPQLLSNLSIYVGTGNINLDNTNSDNKTFIDMDLRTATGNINVNLVASSQIKGNCYLSSATGNLNVVTGIITQFSGSLEAYAGTGNIDINLANASSVADNLHLRAITGNSNLKIGDNASIDGSMHVNTTSGNVAVLLRAGVTLRTDFILKTKSGNANLIFSNLSLADNAISGAVLTTSGNILVSIQQLLDISGNLTLNVRTGSGNINFHIDLELDSLSSTIHSVSGSGNVYYIPSNPLGFAPPSGGYLNSDPPDRSSNIDADLLTTSGNVYVYASRT
jgi:DUF4097 and DUF4098 domain-containing protein YvlB